MEKKFVMKKNVKIMNKKKIWILSKKEEKSAPKKKENENRNQPALESEEQTLKIIEKLNFVIDTFKNRFENKAVHYRENTDAK